MNTQDLAVSVHRLTKRYGHTEVLKDVNIEIEKALFTVCSVPMEPERQRRLRY